jgi:GMP synthase (glutamine-hydrolysing)
MFEGNDKNPAGKTGVRRAGATKAGGKRRSEKEAACGRERPALVILHQKSSSAGMVGEWLDKNGWRYEIRRPPLGDPLPAELARYSGVIVFGGPMSVNDCDPAIRREMGWLERILKADIPFLGICLGAQMMAQVLGAKISPHPQGKVEIGYFPIKPTEAGLSMISDWPQKVFQWHNEGFDIPAAASCLARGDAFPNQAYAYGAKTIGLQFHPEITRAIMRLWIRSASHMLKLEGAHEGARMLADFQTYHGDQKIWLSKLLSHWLAQGHVGATNIRQGSTAAMREAPHEAGRDKY